MSSQSQVPERVKKLNNQNLINELTSSIIHGDTDPEARNMLTREKIKALREIGWDPDLKIKITNRGEYKVSAPFQKCLKDKTRVIDFAYNYFFSEHDKKAEEERKRKPKQSQDLVTVNQPLSIFVWK